MSVSSSLPSSCCVPRCALLLCYLSAVVLVASSTPSSTSSECDGRSEADSSGTYTLTIDPSASSQPTAWPGFKEYQAENDPEQWFLDRPSVLSSLTVSILVMELIQLLIIGVKERSGEGSADLRAGHPPLQPLQQQPHQAHLPAVSQHPQQVPR